MRRILIQNNFTMLQIQRVSVPLLLLSLATFLPTLFLPTLAWAQSADSSARTSSARTSSARTISTRTMSLEEIVVVASRRPQSISQIPASVYVISDTEIETRVRAGIPFKEMLGQLIPSLDIGPQGRTNFGQNLRGRAVQVMIDGVSLTGSRAISRQFDAIDPFNIDHIEVLSGASSIYGGGATGGIINIVTRSGGPGLGVELRGGVRSSGHGGGDKQLGAAIEGGNERVNGRLSMAWHKNGGAYDADGKQIFPDITQTDLQYNQRKDLMGSLNVDAGDAGTLHFLGQHYVSRMDGDKAAYLGPNLAGALGGKPELLAVRSGFSSDVVPQTTRNMFIADWTAPQLVFGQDLLLQTFWRNEKLDFYPFPGSSSVSIGASRTTVPYYGTSRQNTTAYGLKSALMGHLGDNLTLTYGIDFTRERFDATQALFDPAIAYASGGLDFVTVGRVGRYPGFTTRQTAGYVQLDWTVTPSVTISGGLRQQHTAVSVNDFVGFAQQVLIASGVAGFADAIPGGHNHYRATLPNLGVVWSLTPHQQLYVSYAEGFELPDPAKYYGRGDYSLAAIGGRLALGTSSNVNDSPLRAIKTRQLETGVRGNVGPVDYSAAAFYALSDKAIEIVPVTLALNVVDQKVRTYGLEGQLVWQFATQWRVGGNAIALRSENKVGTRWSKAPVTTSSPPKLAAFVSYGSAMGSSVTLQSTTVFNLSDADRNKLHGYTTLDLFGSHRRGSWLFSAGVQNLLNKDYQSIWSQRATIFYSALVAPKTVYFPGQGRNYTMTVTREL